MKNLSKIIESSIEVMDFSQMNQIFGGESDCPKKKVKKTTDCYTNTYCTDPNDQCTNGDTITETMTNDVLSVTGTCNPK